MLALVRILVNHRGMSAEGSTTTGLDFIGVHEAFAETPFGQTLADRVRYAKFKPENVSNERWIALLGPDVSNLDHLIDTYHLTRHFITHTEQLQPGTLSLREQALLQAGAISHDWGEGVPGLTDVSYSDKTAADEQAEKEAFMENLSGFYEGEELMKSLLYGAATQIIFSRDTRLGRMFNGIERIGYVRTGLRADEHVRAGTAPDCEDGLRWLSAEVLSNHHTTHLTMLSGRLLAVDHFLRTQADYITEAFDGADGSIFHGRLHPSQANAKEQAIKDAKELWQVWRDEV